MIPIRQVLFRIYIGLWQKNKNKQRNKQNIAISHPEDGIPVSQIDVWLINGLKLNVTAYSIINPLMFSLWLPVSGWHRPLIILCVMHLWSPKERDTNFNLINSPMRSRKAGKRHLVTIVWKTLEDTWSQHASLFWLSVSSGCFTSSTALQTLPWRQFGQHC